MVEHLTKDLGASKICRSCTRETLSVRPALPASKKALDEATDVQARRRRISRAATRWL